MGRTRTPLFALLAANTLSFIAEAISLVAIPWFVLDLTGSASKVGLIGFFTVLPRVLATFFGGQVVDRAGFRISSIASDLLSGLSVCGIPILYATGNLTFGWLVALVIIGAVFDGPGATAREAMVPELQARSGFNLDQVNSFFQGSRRVSVLIGPMIAGFLVVGIGAANVLWINAAVFATSAIITTLFVPEVGEPEQPEDTTTFWHNTMFGFRFLRQHRLLAWLAGILCVMNFLDGPLATVMVPVLVREHYGSAEWLGILLASFGFGSVLGTFVFSAFPTRFPRRITFIAGFALLAILNLIVAMTPPIGVVLVVVALIGVSVAPINPILMSIRQERVPIRYRARVFGTLTAIAFIAIPLGQLVGGYLIDWWGVQRYIVVNSSVYFALAVSFLFNPVLHEMDIPAAADPAPQAQA